MSELKQINVETPNNSINIRKRNNYKKPKVNKNLPGPQARRNPTSLQVQLNNIERDVQIIKEAVVNNIVEKPTETPTPYASLEAKPSAALLGSKEYNEALLAYQFTMGEKPVTFNEEEEFVPRYTPTQSGESYAMALQSIATGAFEAADYVRNTFPVVRPNGEVFLGEVVRTLYPFRGLRYMMIFDTAQTLIGYVYQNQCLTTDDQVLAVITALLDNPPSDPETVYFLHVTAEESFKDNSFQAATYLTAAGLPARWPITGGAIGGVFYTPAKVEEKMTVLKELSVGLYVGCNMEDVSVVDKTLSTNMLYSRSAQFYVKKDGAMKLISPICFTSVLEFVGILSMGSVIKVPSMERNMTDTGKIKLGFTKKVQPPVNEVDLTKVIKEAQAAVADIRQYIQENGVKPPQKLVEDFEKAIANALSRKNENTGLWPETSAPSIIKKMTAIPVAVEAFKSRKKGKAAPAQQPEQRRKGPLSRRRVPRSQVKAVPVLDEFDDDDLVN